MTSYAPLDQDNYASETGDAYLMQSPNFLPYSDGTPPLLNNSRRSSNIARKAVNFAQVPYQDASNVTFSQPFSPSTMYTPTDYKRPETVTFLPVSPEMLGDKKKHGSYNSTKTMDSSLTIEHPSGLVEWGVGWHQPALMLAFFAAGVGFAVAHHEYYSTMQGKIAGNESHQQWTIWIGTGLTFITLFCLNSANGIAFTQYIWIVVKKHALTVGGLDNLFALLSDITGFFSIEMFKKAKFALLLALVCWCMALTGVIPPGTISVLPNGLVNNATQFTVNTLNWTSADDQGLFIWKKIKLGTPQEQTIAYPPPYLLKQASTVAENMAIANIPSSGSNTSYSMQFYGPGLDCHQPNATQQYAFEFYNSWNANITRTITVDQYQKPYYFENGFSQLQLWSAWSPQLFHLVTDALPDESRPDPYNNWWAKLPPNTTEWFTADTATEFYIQMANSNLVCTLTNASYDISFSDVSGEQSITKNSITNLGTWAWETSTATYLGVLSALAPMIYGNLSILPFSCEGTEFNNGVGQCFIIGTENTQVLLTGLSACDEIQNSWWVTNINSFNTTHQNPPLTINDNSWQCRNKTIDKALEDLVQNLTISMIGANYTHFHPINTTVKGISTSAQPIYVYDSVKLIISYGAAIAASLCITIVGLGSFQINGISHYGSFSAIMTTTRNPDLDELAKGRSIGRLGSRLKKTVLKFGGIRLPKAGDLGLGISAASRRPMGDRSSWRTISDDETIYKGGPGGLYEEVRRLAFGLSRGGTGGVEDLKKGGKYM